MVEGEQQPVMTVIEVAFGRTFNGPVKYETTRIDVRAVIETPMDPELAVKLAVDRLQKIVVDEFNRRYIDNQTDNRSS